MKINLRLSLLFYIGLTFCFLTFPAFSQSKDIPIDPNVRIGKLSNGMTYYIRKNAKPEKRVELRLVVNAGSVQEDDNQLGLAHLVEHMCFNGTKNFPKNDLIHYLQSVGVNFGADINGYTSFDETVYMLTVPSDSEKIVNNGIQIMEDWAHNVSFDPEEVKKERGIVVEEWRLGRGSWQRMMDKYLPVLLKDSKYAKRLPIGTKEIIEGAKYETIKKFYSDWYRPELMAFIVVGDIDPDKIEQKIKNDFSRIKPVANPRKKETYPVPDNDKTMISVVADKENPFNSVYLVYKTETDKTETTEDYRRSLTYKLFTGMINNRLNDLKQQENPPFIYGHAYYDEIWVREKSGYQVRINVGESGLERGLKTALEENERVKRYGFTAVEFERYKKTMLKQLEQQYNEKDKTESGSIVWEYVGNFLRKEPIPGIAFKYNYAKENLPSITIGEVNKIAQKWINDKNRVVIIEGIEKAGVVLPTEASVQNILNSVAGSKIEPYKEAAVSSDLMPQKPTPGKIVSSKQLESIGATELILSNGARVVLKPTNFKNDEILMNAYSPGGQSQFSDDYFASSLFASSVIYECGVASFPKIELDKMMAGKTASFMPIIDKYQHGGRAKSSVQDLETMFKLTHLYFTKPYRDATAFQSALGRQRSMFKNLASNPNFYFYEKSEQIKYNDHPRAFLYPRDSDFEKVNIDKAFEAYIKCFKNAKDFTFIFTGSFKVEEIKPMIETYLASLPSDNSVAAFKDNGRRLVKGPIDKKIYKGSDPKSFVSISMELPVEYSREESHTLWSLGNILQRIYIDKLREEMSGVYGFGINLDVDKFPYSSFNFNMVIPCAPENVDKLTMAVMAEIKNIQENGIKSEDLNKEIESQKRIYELGKTENSTWLSDIERSYKYGESLDLAGRPEQLIKVVNSDNLKKAANKYLTTTNYVRVTLYPEGYMSK